MVLFYIFFVQNFLRKEVVVYVFEVIGMQINVCCIDLWFFLNLLVWGVEVIQVFDILFLFESFNVYVQVFLFFCGKVEVDDISFQQVVVNFVNLIDGMWLKGVLGSFRLESYGVDLFNEIVIINWVEFFDIYVQLFLNDIIVMFKDII